MVYIKELQKEIFPQYIAPYENELFSSWIFRLSTNHGLKTYPFLKHYLGTSISIWNRDIDVLGPDYIRSFIFNHTPMSYFEIDNLFISSFANRAFDSISNNTMNVLSLGIKHRLRTRFGLQCCIKCLQENSYFRKQWRLGTSVSCTKHKQYLIDRCPKCYKPIVFFRSNMKGNQSAIDFKFDTLSICYNCSFDFRFYESEPVTSKVFNFQKYINHLIDDGSSSEFVSFSYLRGLFLLSKRAVSNTKDNRFRIGLSCDLGYELPIFPKEMKFWNVSQRAYIYSLIHDLILNKSDQLEKIFVENRILRSSIVKDSKPIPDWLNDLFQH